MGLIKSAKTSGAMSDADRARKEGRPIFIYRFEMPHWGAGYSGSVSGAAEVVEAIESAGWTMTHITESAGEGRRGAFILVFRPR